uniref:Uncharacterized protein n=1 Tax=Anopheles minimus TaxID=112268 RepID=A0A182W1R2_9DIPT
MMYLLIFTQRYGNSNNDICRLCLKNEAHMEPLFYSNLFPNILLTKKIYDCTSIQIIYERNLPMFVCKLCANKLDEYVRFRDRCIANDEFLRNALAAFDANGGGNCSSAIKMEPEDTPPPPLPPSAPTTAKFAQCLAVTPMELNCALVAAAAAAAGHQNSKREPPDVEETHSRYGHGSGAITPDRSSCSGRMTTDELPTVKQTHEDHYRSGEEDELPAHDAYGDPTQTDAKQYVCDVCSKSFKIRHHLLVHRHTHVDNHAAPINGMLHGGTEFNGTVTGSGKQSYNCPKCAKVFVNKGNLLNHLETHTNEKSYACDICTKTFKYNVQLRLHMRIHTGERPHKCEICNRGFSQLSNLRSHRKTHSKKVLQMHAPKCVGVGVVDGTSVPSAPVTPVSESIPDSPSPAGTAVTLSGAASATVAVTNNTPTLSEALSDLLRYEIALRAPLELQQMLLGHIDRKKPTNGTGGKGTGRRYRCDVCFKGYSQYPSLIKHRKLHFKVPPLVKVLAGKGRHADYEEHEDPEGADCDEQPRGPGRRGTTPEPHDPIERPYSCDICGKNFKYNRNLKVHTKLHIKANRFKCDKCTTTFAQAEDLKQHLHTHPTDAGRSYSCEYCSNRFRSNEDLKRHRRSHTGERPYRCPRCPKAFTQQKLHRLWPHRSIPISTMSVENRHIKEETSNEHRAGEGCSGDGTGESEPGEDERDCHQQRDTRTIYSLNMNVCRLCLSDGHGQLQPVFYAQDSPDEILQQKIFELTTVEITFAFDFPTSVCIECLAKLDEFSVFRRQCIDNNEILKLKYYELKAEADAEDYCPKQESKDNEDLHISKVKKEEEFIPIDRASVIDEQRNGTMVDAIDDPVPYVEDGAGNEIIIGDGQEEYGVSDQPVTGTKIQYVTEDGTMTEYITSGAIVRREVSPSDLEEPGGDGQEIYYTVGPDTYAIPTGAAEVANYVPQGFADQTEIECTTIEDHLPEEYVEEIPAVAVTSMATANTHIVMAASRGRHDRPFVCKHCKTSFKYEHNYDRHMKNHAKVLYRCGKCSKTFVKLRKCQQHFRKAHSSQRYECDICYRTYSLPTRLENHVIEMHSVNGVYRCDRCQGEMFSSYLDFKAHRMRYHPRTDDASTGSGLASGTDLTPTIIKQTSFGDVVHMEHVLSSNSAYSSPNSPTPSSESEEHQPSKEQTVRGKRPSMGGVVIAPRTRARTNGHNNRTVKAQKPHTIATSSPQQHEVILIDDDEQQQTAQLTNGTTGTTPTVHRELLQQIEESEANSSGPKMYTCDNCPKTFVHLNNLKAHIYAEHDNDKPFKCKLCPISYSMRKTTVPPKMERKQSTRPPL